MPPLRFERSFNRPSVPRGCGRRVSLNRRSSTASDASRKTTRVGIMRRTECKMPGACPASILRAHPPRGPYGGSRWIARPTPRNPESTRPEGYRRSSSPDPQKPSVPMPFPDPLIPVIMTSSEGCWVLRLEAGAFFPERFGPIRAGRGRDFRGVIPWIVASKTGKQFLVSGF